MSDSKIDPYKGLRYDSYPYYQSHPDRLFTIGKLFGANPADPNVASVLEVGCGSGSNLIPIASQYPLAKAIGIDASGSQISKAQDSASHLGLQNIVFENLTASDYINKYDQFDYIIMHNVISWVDDATRSMMFDLCAKLLKPEGIAFLSYNVKAGFAVQDTLRDMLIYNSQKIQDLEGKITQAKTFLAFTVQALDDSNLSFAQSLKIEAQSLLANENALIDHLINPSKSFNFNEFNEELNKRELQYLSDTYLPSMYIGNAPANIIPALEQVGSIVDIEEYLDFFTNRQFKTSMVCHKSVKINRDVSNTDLNSFYMLSNMIPELPSSQISNLEDLDQALNFYIKPSATVGIKTESPIMKAILYTIVDNASVKPIKVEEILNIAGQKLPTYKREEIATEFAKEAMNLIFSGYIDLTHYVPNAVVEIGDKPKISNLARHQAMNNSGLWVTNLRGQMCFIELFEKYAFRYMDGNYNLDEMAEFIYNHVQQGDLSFTKDNKVLKDKDEVKGEIMLHLQDALNFAKQACLLSQ